MLSALRCVSLCVKMASVKMEVDEVDETDDRHCSRSSGLLILYVLLFNHHHLNTAHATWYNSLSTIYEALNVYLLMEKYTFAIT